MVATAILESKKSCSQVRVNHRTDKHNWIKEITVIITKAGMDPNNTKSAEELACHVYKGLTILQ